MLLMSHCVFRTTCPTALITNHLWRATSCLSLVACCSLLVALRVSLVAYHVLLVALYVSLVTYPSLIACCSLLRALRVSLVAHHVVLLAYYLSRIANHLLPVDFHRRRGDGGLRLLLPPPRSTVFTCCILPLTCNKISYHSRLSLISFFFLAHMIGRPLPRGRCRVSLVSSSSLLITHFFFSEGTRHEDRVSYSSSPITPRARV